ncbi:MAG: hypothetical protein IJU95_06905 [Treponema sp.]|nr:hypothetical protein [Treponema sp.]
MIDTDSLLKGADYSELKESYIIFICLDDPFGFRLPAYTFERKCKENALVDLDDKTHHVIFNAEAYEKETNPGIRAFLSFVRNNTAGSDLTREIAAMVQTKKFEQTFINEYLAWNLHDKDVERRGRNEGQNTILALNKRLIASGRIDDLSRASTDSEYLAQLLKEEGLQTEA